MLHQVLLKGYIIRTIRLLVHGSYGSNADSTYITKDSSDANLSISASLPDTLISSEPISQVVDTVRNVLPLPEPLLFLEGTGTPEQKVQIEPESQTEQDTDSALEESDDSQSPQLFDPEYTNEELANKKRFYQTFLWIDCVMGGLVR
jgi:hypothetical protein